MGRSRSCRQKSASIGESDRHVERAEEIMNWRPSRTRLDFLSGLLGLLGMVLRVVPGMALSVVLAMLIGLGFFAAAGSAQSVFAQAGQTIQGQTRGRQIEAPKASAEGRGGDSGEI